MKKNITAHRQSLNLLLVMAILLSLVIPMGMPMVASGESGGATHEFVINTDAITVSAGTGDNIGKLAVQQNGSVTTYVYAEDTIRINGTGDSTTNIIAVNNVTANITLSGVNISSTTSNTAAFELTGEANVTLTLEGTNTLKSGLNRAGLQVPAGNTLTIKGSGSLNATGGDYGAGIGGGYFGSGGTITIAGGTVTATGGEFGAGIGGGLEGDGGDITINDGTVTATGSQSGAGIGGGVEGAGGTIIINDGTVTATGGEAGAGIGGGNLGVGGAITINDGTVTATGGVYSAGIGGGRGRAGGTITINGGTVTATGDRYGAGIGGGWYGTGGAIIINNHPTVIATGSDGGADIGNGFNYTGSELTVIKDENNDALTYVRLLAKNRTENLNDKSITVNNVHVYITNAQGLTGFFLIKSSDTEHSLKVEAAPVVIKIKPGDVQNIRKTINTAANLTGLTISSGTLEPAFASGTTAYSASVGNSVSSITLTPTAADSNATVSVNGTAVASGTASGAINLNIGTNTITVVVAAVDLTTTTTYTIEVTRAAASNGSSGSDTSPRERTAPPAVTPPDTGDTTLATASGTETTQTVNGRTEVTLVVDTEKINDQMAAAMEDPAGSREIILAVTNTGDTTKVLIGADLLKNLQDNGFTITVKEETIAYSLDTTNMNNQTIARQMGLPADSLANMEIEISISKLPSDQAQAFARQAQTNGHTLLFMPVQFDITARTILADETVQETNITRFTRFAERILEMPAGTDPDSIGTAVVFNPNGTYSHVPTRVFRQNGTTQVSLNSLTNSVYTVIANQVTLDSVKGHWSALHVNDMATRLVLTSHENFQPDQTITRAAFADYMVRALGVYREGLNLTNKFTDIDTNHHKTSILIANDWGIVQGYPDNTFKPEATITREEAMVIYAKAMDLAGLLENRADRINTFSDSDQVSVWATPHVRKAVNASIFSGKGHGILDPKGTLTHAESLTAIRNLLLAAGLIND